MDIIELKVVRGPNIWSNYRQNLIVMRLDLEDLEMRPTHRIEGFADRIKKLLPSLISHQCSEGHKGGFFQRVEQGTWMGHVIEHIALEIQTLAGMDSGYGRTRSTDTRGVYHVVFAYRDASAGKYAARAAVRIAEALVAGQEYDLENDIRKLRGIAARNRAGCSTAAIIEAARSDDIPVRRLTSNLTVLGYGYRQKIINASVASTTSALGIQIAQDKQQTRNLLKKSLVPVPDGKIVSSESELLEISALMKFPLVVKPHDGNMGRGITTDIRTEEHLVIAYRSASAVSEKVILEEFIPGDDFRFLVINYKFQAAARRTPATVTGNGKSSIRELISEMNTDPRRGEGYDKALSLIKISPQMEQHLSNQGYDLDSVPSKGKNVSLSFTANISTGGTSEDVTAKVHPYNINLAERIARVLSLDICGIDIIATDVTKPVTRNNGAVVEVNAGPGLRMHLYPQSGVPRNVVKPIIKMLFPDNNGRIPLIAIAGSRGTTLTTKLVAHLFAKAEKNVGYVSTEGMSVNGHIVKEGDCTGTDFEESLLYDPTVNLAVMECTSDCILKSGLAFDSSDISIVLNSLRPSRAMDDVKNAEEMSRVHCVVPRTTHSHGYAILNARDDNVFAMIDQLSCHIALFSSGEGKERINEHCSDGGTAIFIEDNEVLIQQGRWVTHITDTPALPIKSDDSLQVQSALAAILSAYLRRMPVNDIRQGLKSFHADAVVIDPDNNKPGHAKLSIVAASLFWLFSVICF